MVDDYRYSIGRTVVYSHPKPGRRERDYGQHGPGRTVGVVRAVELGRVPEHVWLYTVENLRTGEIARVHEPEIHYAMFGKGDRRVRGTKADAERLAEALTQALSESALSSYLRTTVRDLLRREESAEQAKMEGRDLPIRAGDYVRIRGELRPEIESYHNHYAKILEAREPDIAAIQSKDGPYKVRRSYRILLEDGSEHWIYDPEIKLYYTADGRATILNWRAATFLAESFGDDPPYSVEFSFLEDHVFSRDELEAMPHEDLMNLFAALLYVKGRVGLRDLADREHHFGGVPKEHLVDSVLAISRFNMRKNRSFTPSEIESKRREAFKLRRLLRGR